MPHGRRGAERARGPGDVQQGVRDRSRVQAGLRDRGRVHDQDRRAAHGDPHHEPRRAQDDRCDRGRRRDRRRADVPPRGRQGEPEVRQAGPARWPEHARRPHRDQLPARTARSGYGPRARVGPHPHRASAGVPRRGVPRDLQAEPHHQLPRALLGRQGCARRDQHEPRPRLPLGARRPRVLAAVDQHGRHHVHVPAGLRLRHAPGPCRVEA